MRCNIQPSLLHASVWSTKVNYVSKDKRKEKARMDAVFVNFKKIVRRFRKWRKWKC